MMKETETQHFAVALQANTLLHNERNEYNNNELRVEGWDENNVKSIPIEAFFYFINTQNGYANAVKYRNDFYAQSGDETIPLLLSLIHI